MPTLHTEMPLADATGFAQWKAAHRLVERGARTGLDDAAALGLMDRLEAAFETEPLPSQPEVDHAFWEACHGGQRAAAEFMLDRGADINWLPDRENLTPVQAAERQGSDDLVRWLRTRGGKSYDELR